MIWETPFASLVQKFLPPGAVLAKPRNSYGASPVQLSDMNGDGVPEMAAAYKLNNKVYVMVIKDYNSTRADRIDIGGPGYDVSYLYFADITGDGHNDLIIGWQLEPMWSEMEILVWSRGRFNRIVKGMRYSFMEVEDLPSKYGRDGITEIAVWNHEGEEAYSVNVLRWNGSELVQANDLYPEYFEKAISYYEQKTAEAPDNAVYRYYLADALIKAGKTDEALEAIRTGVGLNRKSPSKKEFERLQDKAAMKAKSRYPELYPASVNTVGGIKWGYINKTGSFALKPVFDWSQGFQENGRAIVTIDGLSGIIDMSGNFILEPEYYDIGEFSEGRAVVVGEGGFKLIDEQGKAVFESSEFIGPLREGRAEFAYRKDSKRTLFGYINRYGKVVIQPEYEATGTFSSGKAVVKLEEGMYAIIGLKGEIIRKLNYAFVGDISESLLPFRQKPDGKYGYINEKGKVVIAPVFTGVEGFKNGRAVVNTTKDYTGRFGLIDKRGRFAINTGYSSMCLLGEGMAAVGIPAADNCAFGQHKYAIADIDGTLLTDFVYYGVSDYKDGLASVYDNYSTFFIDRSGRRATGMPVFNGIGTLCIKDGIVMADVDNRLSYLDKNGDNIRTQDGNIRLSRRYSIHEAKYRPNRNYLVYYPQISGMTDKKLQRNVNAKLRNIAAADGIDTNEELDFEYEGEFNVDLFKGRLAVLRIYGYRYPFGAAHGMPRKDFVHVNVRNGRFYELKDLFKPDSSYTKVLSEIIGQQIEDSDQKDEYWYEREDIKEDNTFYVTGDALHVYFYPYCIAPYAAGFPEFEIPFARLMDIIDTEGEFWNSFN